MAEDRVRRAALAYMARRLGKDARFVDATPDQDGWMARVVVTEGRGKGGAAPKQWHVLYEVHLGPALEELYHVRKGFWDKALPAEEPEPAPEAPEAAPAPAPEPKPAAPARAPEPAPAPPDSAPGPANTADAPAKPAPVEEEGKEDGATTRVRIGFVAPRAGDTVEAGGTTDAGGVEDVERQPQPPIGPDAGYGTGAEAPGERSREKEAIAVTSGREDDRPGEERLEDVEAGGSAESLDEGPATDEAEGAETVAGDEGESVLEGLPGLADEPENEPGAAPGPLGEAGQRAEPTPAATGVPRPMVGEKQGPPKVNFRFVLEGRVRETRE